MLSLNYPKQYSTRPVDGLDIYCRLEGLDPVYLRSLQKSERAEGAEGAFGRFFRKWIRKYKAPRQLK